MHELILALWNETGMTIFMVTHDIAEAFKLGTRLIVFDKVRHDPHDPSRYGATITYDLPLRRPTATRGDLAAASVSAADSARPDHFDHQCRCQTEDGRRTMIFGPQRERRGRRAGLAPVPERAHRHHPDFNARESRGWKAVEAEGRLPEDGWRREQQWALDMGLPGADSLTDKSIPTFARGELPHFAGINTFLKAPYVENVRDVGKYDAAIVGIPFDSGTTYRPGTRFGPQGIRRISALYTPYNYELGVDLREQMTLCDAGDVFTIPANLEKSFDQISRGVSHVFSSGALPMMLGGDHSIGFPCVRGIAQCTSKRIGIIHFDRHIDIQEKDLDERMHTTPWYWATNLPNVPATNLVQLGIGGWQVPRAGRRRWRASATPTS